MPLRVFHNLGGANGDSIINPFEDWFAAQGFDSGTQTASISGGAAAAPLAGAEGPLKSAATVVPAGSPLHYFLKVAGATGDATLKGFEGWFSVDGFDWGVQNATAIGSASTGAGAGKTTFSPLTVDIHSLSGLATLFADVAKGETCSRNTRTVFRWTINMVMGKYSAPGKLPAAPTGGINGFAQLQRRSTRTP